jgi:DNA-binding CsgD family transcriptional regulator
MRNTREEDLDQCLRLAPERFLYDCIGLELVRRMWSLIIATGAGEAGVLVDPRRPDEVLFFGFSVFVTNDRADAYHNLLRPRIAYELALELSAGGRPFLTLDEIGRANAEAGLNLVIIHYGFIAAAGDDGLGDRLRYATFESFRKHHEGLNFRSFTNEVFDPSSQAMGSGWGFRVGWYTEQQLNSAGIPLDRAPCVWMATREDAHANPGAVFPSLLFRTFEHPQFRFDLREQRLLKLALDGYTDELIAIALGMSMSTTKKRFRCIYEKVMDCKRGADFFSLESNARNGARGVEIRRHLLNYLRNHPEELHPYNARKGKGQAHSGHVTAMQRSTL